MSVQRPKSKIKIKKTRLKPVAPKPVRENLGQYLQALCNKGRIERGLKPYPGPLPKRSVKIKRKR